MSEEKTSNEMENLSLQTKNRCPRDLLRRFTVPISGIGAPRSSYPDEDPGSGDEIELNLGLSLGGRFGVDKGNSKLIRSSSIATILPVVRNDDVLDSLKNPGSGPGRAYSGLVRTSSLPVETEEEWRKRKELQSLKRLAAKRRRSEKQRNVTKGERDDYVAAMGRVGSSPGPCFGSDKWSEFDARSRQRQGSSGSVGQTSLSLQERKNKVISGSSRITNESPIGMERESQDKTRMKEIGSDSVEEMPCVFTQGDGPNGRVIEGILYKYGKGEKVKIMCVCHGSFLSPAEFVKHAGGTDIAHPLKHIVVKASPSLS